LTKLTILDARNTRSKEKVTSFNEVCLKATQKNFLQVENDGSCTINEIAPEINESSMFKIVKSNVPDLPEWLFKRPHLNHNNITKEYMPFLSEHAAQFA